MICVEDSSVEFFLTKFSFVLWNTVAEMALYVKDFSFFNVFFSDGHGSSKNESA